MQAKYSVPRNNSSFKISVFLAHTVTEGVNDLVRGYAMST